MYSLRTRVRRATLPHNPRIRAAFSTSTGANLCGLCNCETANFTKY